jgi:hypothetical protein
MKSVHSLLLGFAQCDITPSGPVETVGFGRTDELSRGVLAPLCAQVSIWQLGPTRCCLVTMDHIGFSRSHAEELRDQLSIVLGIAHECVMLCFSHCHSAPNDSAVPGYFLFVCRQVCEAAEQALCTMASVDIAWGNGHTSIGVNRRVGSSAMDDRLGILKVCDAATGRLRLLFLRLTAHNNVLKADNYLISPDYFGAVRDALQKRYGCPVMAAQGASGDIAPRFFQSALLPPDAPDSRFVRSAHALEEMAQLVLHDASPVIDALHPTPVSCLKMRSNRILLTADVPSPARAAQVAAEAKTACGIDGTGWLAEADRLWRNGVRTQQENVEVQYFKLGDGCLCGVANEIMSEFACKASAQLGDEFFYLGGYTNGCTGYFPTEAEFDQGGYEVYWSMLIYYIYHGRVFPLRRDSASELIRFVVQNAPR